jgi:hypothetical protein
MRNEEDLAVVEEREGRKPLPFFMPTFIRQVFHLLCSYCVVEKRRIVMKKNKKSNKKALVLLVKNTLLAVLVLWGFFLWTVMLSVL